MTKLSYTCSKTQKLSWIKFSAGSIFFVGAVVLASASAKAEYAQGSLVYDKVFYQIGGGSAVMTPPARKRPHEISLGIGWQANLMCGNFDFKTTIKNQLNGITEGFRDLMDNVIQSATGAVASLPAMVIQRANPQLYDILTNGLYQGKLDFESMKTSCEELANKAADYMADSGWSMMAKTQNYQNIANSGEKDAIRAKKKADEEEGKQGVSWIGGDKKGGEGQDPLSIIKDVVSAGYNIANGRGVKTQSTIPAASCDGRLCSTWASPKEASDWAIQVLGETVQRTCPTCGKTSKTAGQGLAPIIEDENIAEMIALEKALNKDNPTTEDLMAISASNMPITRGLLEALKEDPEVRLLASRLSGEIAISRTLEKALLLRRTMLSGMKEPNVANNKEALAELDRQLLMLDREIDQVQMEMDLQRKLTGNTALAALEKRALDRQKSLQNNSPDDTDKRIKSLTGNVKDAQADNSNGGNFNITETYITLPIPSSSGGLSGVGGFWGSTGSYGGNSGSYASRDLRAYESSNAYADGRATVYKTADGTLVRREGGSLAWRNNNPGNIRAGEFAKSMGAIGVGPSGFAIFPDAETGERAIHALLKTKNYSNNTIAGAISRYAPPSENNTELYISMVTKATGLDRNTSMSALSDEHRAHIVNAIKKHEGWIVGSTK